MVKEVPGPSPRSLKNQKELGKYFSSQVSLDRSTGLFWVYHLDEKHRRTRTFFGTGSDWRERRYKDTPRGTEAHDIPVNDDCSACLAEVVTRHISERIVRESHEHSDGGHGLFD